MERFIIQTRADYTYDLVNTSSGEAAQFTTLATIERVAAVLNNPVIHALCSAAKETQRRRANENRQYYGNIKGFTEKFMNT